MCIMNVRTYTCLYTCMYTWLVLKIRVEPAQTKLNVKSRGETAECEKSAVLAHKIGLSLSIIIIIFLRLSLQPLADW